VRCLNIYIFHEHTECSEKFAWIQDEITPVQCLRVKFSENPVNSICFKSSSKNFTHKDRTSAIIETQQNKCMLHYDCSFKNSIFFQKAKAVCCEKILELKKCRYFFFRYQNSFHLCLSLMKKKKYIWRKKVMATQKYRISENQFSQNMLYQFTYFAL